MCSSIPTLVSSLLLSHAIASASSISPPSYCGEAERTSLLPNTTGGHQLKSEPVHGAQPSQDKMKLPNAQSQFGIKTGEVTVSDLDEALLCVLPVLCAMVFMRGHQQ